MERESLLDSDKQHFQGSDELTSKTSVQRNVWSLAAGVLLQEGAAQRMNGKVTVGKSNEAVLNFSQIGDLVIVQFSGHVSAFGLNLFDQLDYLTDQSGNFLTDQIPNLLEG